jgi:hypothetical protein
MRCLRKRRADSRRVFLDTTSRLEDWPAVQVTPEAIGSAGDQAPLAQRWNEVPPIQFHWPSEVQEPVRPPLPGVELLTGELLGAEVLGAESPEPEPLESAPPELRGIDAELMGVDAEYEAAEVVVTKLLGAALLAGGWD